MSKFDRIYDLLSILHSRRYAITINELAEQLECSKPTVKRYISKLRNEYGVPLRYDYRYNGYILDGSDDETLQFPGLWFNISELHSLLIIHELIDHLEPGLLKAELTPLRQRIKRMLSSRKIKTGELIRRIRFIGVGLRVCCPLHFKVAAKATMERNRLKLRYHSRGKNRMSSRTISPQRLLHYRGNWFLAAWCHTRKGLRTLALDRIREILPTDVKCIEVADEKMDDHFGESFGIFSGQPEKTATLRFTPERARWVAEESWHPNQTSQWLADGTFELILPYSDPRELILEILKYGPDVEVIAPATLRRKVKKRLTEALKKYGDGKNEKK